MLKSILVVSAGGAIGCVARWVVGAKLNSVLPSIPLGTLLANLAGCYLIGLAIAYLGARPELAPEWRLFIVTGFLGGLTTFSTLSAEVAIALQAGRLATAFGELALHVGGGLLLVFLGMATAVSLR
ncbi:fluoride efflux transporter CrcB [Oxalicibacterium solurbis]|uniref:Fluoride-specific ion channel FluC n=1 Tax=Oxalicibacterium solurbis TaxID=69280 RepID=A0A8J3B1M9_9BURK|nr:fluoride efflux transporter CrcB [Oxalicibacterium solurbis]GGI55446.1 putative fluoride ion transporter CrcB [Oxalicibacterium solurbis]